ncbi:uncharacterized protein PODANS_5_3600 [Podospora anserina S mat+]|uniref:Podospora anserina S mat+ genomic DNA chromosome 5, supercontig 4 n=1 Tax=Podospora anserina (strain S / ATCC MYA-4624 / DSM 980 / FGSC 10383) TaxID=515849 RepID=B2ALH0_PODAN|nr:uncharacterized protein PODANS_5_3600 [Podospora anserina S mat+]CAP64808.1 unnamed protein product [Podospora anserina S mat+]CDP29318.1 Putative protein of unknown function [Podospora anserina S mat+]
MFRWYREAQVCYAYLSDVNHDDDHRAKESGFGLSRWFTRGWTLQEIIAPPVVYFFASDWQGIGSRHGLLELIVDITRIHHMFFISGNLSIFQRMAYCLLGIFDINMPLLYGEGHRAFQRLQEEILKDIEDDSIFYHGGIERSILAYEPRNFQNSSNLVAGSWPYSSQNLKGIVARNISVNKKRIEMTVMAFRDPSGDSNILTVLLNCAGASDVGRASSCLDFMETSPGILTSFYQEGLDRWEQRVTATMQLMREALPMAITLVPNGVGFSSESNWETGLGLTPNLSHMITIKGLIQSSTIFIIADVSVPRDFLGRWDQNGDEARW